MLRNETIANFLTAKFKEQDPTNELRLGIFPDVHKVEPWYFVQGILVANQSDGEPLPMDNGYLSRNYSYFISFALVDKDVCTRAIAFNNAITNGIALMQGKTFELDGGQVVFTFDVPFSRGAGWIEGGGAGSISTLNFSVLYTKNATTTSNKVWLLDGIELPYLDESIELEKQGATNSVFGLKATQSLPIKQTKYYKFTLPFDNANSVCKDLQKDMLDGNMVKTYSLQYYDGSTYIQDQPYKTTVSLFRTSGSTAARPGVSNFTVVFTDVDNDTGPTLYEMALIDNPFDDGSVNARWFPDREEQQKWFANKISVGAPYSAIKAPNLNSLTITQQVYFVADNSNLDLNDLLTKNYAVIKATNRESGQIQRYYYYYIQTVTVGSNNQILVDLKMDTIQTYYFDPNIQIPDCIINRAHLNRWLTDDNGKLVLTADGKVQFDCSPNSALFEREEFQGLAKRLITRTPLVQKYDTAENSAFNKFLRDNVRCWVQVYLKRKDSYKFRNMENGEMYDKKIQLSISFDENSTQENMFETPYNALCYPIMNTIKLSNGSIVTPSISFKDSLDDNFTKQLNFNSVSWIGDGSVESDGKTLSTGFINLNNDTSNVLTIKVTNIAPFSIQRYFNNGTLKSKSYKIIHASDGTPLVLECLSEKIRDKQAHPYSHMSFGGLYIFDTTTTESKKLFGEGLASFDYYNNTNNLFTEFVNTNYTFQFTKEEVKQSVNNYKFNPKLLTEDFTELQLTYSGNSYIYDPLKIGKKSMQFLTSEMLSPDITRVLCRYYTQSENEIFTPATLTNFTGLATMQETSLPYDNEKLAEMLASQPNFFLQQGGGQAADFLRAGKEKLTKMGVANEEPLNTVEGALSVRGYAKNALTIDNMQKAPKSLLVSSGGALFNISINKLEIYLDIYECLFQEKLEAHNYMMLYGYAFNRLGSLKNSFDTIRHYYNYVQAQIESIYGVSISNDARNNLRQRFAAGIRFWKTDIIDYSKENYEEDLK